MFGSTSQVRPSSPANQPQRCRGLLRLPCANGSGCATMIVSPFASAVLSTDSQCAFTSLAAAGAVALDVRDEVDWSTASHIQRSGGGRSGGVYFVTVDQAGQVEGAAAAAAAAGAVEEVRAGAVTGGRQSGAVVVKPDAAVAADLLGTMICEALAVRAPRLRLIELSGAFCCTVVCTLLFAPPLRSPLCEANSL